MYVLNPQFEEPTSIKVDLLWSGRSSIEAIHVDGRAIDRLPLEVAHGSWLVVHDGSVLTSKAVS